MMAFRRNHPVLTKEAFYTDADIRWFSPEGTLPNWRDPAERRLACMILGQEGPDLFLMFNAGIKTVTFALPVPPEAGRWHLTADTWHPFPQDLLEDGQEILLKDQLAYRVGPQSSVILISQPSPAEGGGQFVENA
jgi:glycogen operon protein